MKMRRSVSIPVSFALALLAGASLFADDRDLLKSPTSAPANVMVLLSNDEEMAKCFPQIGQFNNLSCPTITSGTYSLAYGGMGDSLYSKFGVAKNVLRTVIQANINGTDSLNKLNWGITSFATNYGNFQTTSAKKQYQFQAIDDTFDDSDGWAYQPATWSITSNGTTTASGPTIINFGAPVGTANDVNYGTNPSPRIYRLIQYDASTGLGSETWIKNPGGDTSGSGGNKITIHQPYSGSTGTSQTIVWNPSDTRYEVLISTPTASVAGLSSPYRIKRCSGASTDATCTIDTSNFPGTFDGDYFSVTKTLIDCSNTSGRTAPCDPLDSKASIKHSAMTVRYVVPPIFCADSDSTCRFPTVYGYGSQAREEMGSSNYSTMQESNNNGGWAFQSNNNPQPMIMIPHDYPNFTPYTGSTPATTSAQRAYTQNGGNCILRALRPGSAVYDNTANTTAGLTAEHDYYPIYDPTVANSDGTDLSNSLTSGCDKLVDGAYQTDSYRLDSNDQPTENKTQEIIPSMFPRNGSGNNVPLIGGLTNVFQYFNGGNNPGSCNAIVDGFCGGVRPDDPHGACRQNAVILITDSLIPSTGTFQFGKSSDPTTELAAISVPVYVVGFSYSSTPNSDACTLPDGTSGNTGQCIAYYTGAQTYVNGKVDRVGYFEANDAAGLQSALHVIISELNETNRDFATATIPSVSATSEGLAYFASFNPRTNKAIWSGHLRNYVIDPLTGVVDTDPLTGKFVHTPFSFWSGSTPSSGTEVWDVGNGGDTDDTQDLGILGNKNLTDVTQVLAAGTAWADTTHDQASLFGSAVGRNLIFGIRPGDANCPSNNAVQCAAQLPPGSGGNNTTEPYVAPSKPTTLPTWWDFVKTNYMKVTTVRTGEADIDQTTQNDFSFFRGNRDPVVEALQLVGFSTAGATTCDGIDTYNGSVTGSSLVSTPCYRGEVMGDIFHSNPTLVSFPFNVAYLTASDPGSGTVGLYNNRGNSYVSFFQAHRFRRKVLFAGSDDGFLHAFDLGVFNGDLSTFIPDSTKPSETVTPLKGAYDFGSGREIFGYAPLAALRKFDALTHATSQDYMVDGAATADDVYIDLTNVGGTPAGVPAPTSSTSTDSSHAWRTVLVGVEREGGLPVTASAGGAGGTIFALDITDPDNPEHQNSNLNTDPTASLDLTVQNPASGHSPDCLVNAPADGTLGAAPGGCSQPHPYPMVLWEIDDSSQPSIVPDATTPGQPAEPSTSTEASTQDMGRTWSRPQIGRVKICTSGCGSTPVYTDFFVAVLGGGYEHAGSDPQDLATTNLGGNTGNFLYMIDIETGKVIWKRNVGLSGAASVTTSEGNLAAAVPAEPSLVDYNGDGYSDRIYIGDTQGRLWKVALDQIPTWDSTNHRVDDTDTNWNPTLFFDEFQATTAADMATKFPGAVRQPIFERAGVSLLATTASGPKLVVAFGTGDRDNMPMSTDVNQNVFVVAVDDPTRPASDYPIYLNKAAGGGDLTLVDITATNPGSCTSSNCLNDRGYYVQLPQETGGAQVVNTAPLIFNSTIFFNTFLRRATDANNPSSENPCNLTGQAFAYALNFFTGISQVTANGLPALPTADPYVLIASDPIVYQYGGNVFPYTTASGTNVLDSSGATALGTTHAVFATDLGAKQANVGKRPNVNIKSWKEQ